MIDLMLRPKTAGRIKNRAPPCLGHEWNGIIVPTYAPNLPPLLSSRIVVFIKGAF